MNKNKPFTPLEVMDGKALLELDVPPTKYIVADLLPVGLHLLAGSPKIGGTVKKVSHFRKQGW